MSFDPVTALFNIGDKLIERLWPDPESRDKAKLQLMEMNQKGELARLAASTDLAKAQLAINSEEAKHKRLFVSGWRPFIGWVCGVAFAYHFVLQPLLLFIFAAQNRVVELPTFDMYGLLTVLGGLLGLGSLRTVEKLRGKA